MKECRVCKQNKPREEFYNRTKTVDGKHTECKSCYSLRVKAYTKTDRHKELKTIHTYKYNRENPERKKAVDKVYYALETGVLIKEPCGICGEIKVQAHHNWGYEGKNALRIMWLCGVHHKAQHNLMKHMEI